MLAGSIFVTFCLFTLAWASEIVRLVVKDEEKVGGPPYVKSWN